MLFNYFTSILSCSFSLETVVIVLRRHSPMKKYHPERKRLVYWGGYETLVRCSRNSSTVPEIEIHRNSDQRNLLLNYNGLQKGNTTQTRNYRAIWTAILPGSMQWQQKLDGQWEVRNKNVKSTAEHLMVKDNLFKMWSRILKPLKKAVRVALLSLTWIWGM